MDNRAISQRISHYRIVSKLGSGGMGEVYLAEDTQLDRKVAIKFLPSESVADEQAKRRLIREAKAAAKLDHPHICAIYEVAEEDGCDFIVMQYVEGETLASRIQRTPLGLKEALDIGAQIADALAEAHSRAIIHRDIKPQNIMLTSRGQVKILDFGLAKIVTNPTLLESNAETQSLVTESGVVVGTVPYMSPEQVKGNSLDVRSDLFSFGAVLYEMFSGHQPFASENPATTFTAILTREPTPLARYSTEVPAELERIVSKALRKDREERYQTAKDLLLDLKSLNREMEITANLGQPKTSGLHNVTETIDKPAHRSVLKYVFTSAAVVLALLLVARLTLFRRGEIGQLIRPAEYVQLTNFTDSATQPALSPDGRMLTFIRGEGTFITTGQIYVKLLPGGEPSQLTRDDFIKMGPVFSPDGSRIAYTVGPSPWTWDTWQVSVLGGESRQLLPNASGLTWFVADGLPRLLFSEIRGKGLHMGIVTASESRSDARDVYMPPNETGMAHRSSLSPDRRSVLLVEMDKSRWLPCRVVPFDGSSAGREVGPQGAPCTYASWSPDGHWIYLSANTGAGFHIWRQRFPEGAPEQVTFGATEEEGIAIAPDGHSFVTSTGTSQSSIWIHDTSGERQVSSEGYGLLPSFSSDARKIYYLLRSGSNPYFVAGELWQAESDSGRRERLLPDFIMTYYDIAADSNRTLFSVPSEIGKFVIWIASLDRRFSPRQLVVADSERVFLSPQGDVFFLAEEGNGKHIYRMKEDGTGKQQLSTDPVEFLVGLSPDGKWVVAWVPSHGESHAGMEATSNAVVAYPTAGGSPLLICDNCAHAGGPARGVTPPLVKWSPDGRYIYFSLYDKPIAVPLPPGQSFPVLPDSGLSTQKELTSLPGAVVMARKGAFPGPNPSLYTFCRVQSQRNLYQIPVQ